MTDDNERLVPVQVESKIKERVLEVRKEFEHLELAFEAASEAGEAAERRTPGSSAPLRAKVQALCAIQREKELEILALEALKSDYECWSAKEFDFESYLKTKTRALEPGTPVNDAPLKAFDAAVRGGGETLDDDAEFMVVGGGGDGAKGVKNAKCPLSLKKVEDLDEPLEDLKGYVYEAAAILDYLGRKTSVPCPVAGTVHTVKRADLKPSKAVQRLKARHLAASRANDNERDSQNLLVSP